jgi:hypothetical protein
VTLRVLCASVVNEFMLTVHLRINDAETGQPTPVRLRITGPDGTVYAPLGMPAYFPVGTNEAVGGQVRIDKENWWYVSGSFEIKLPSEVPLRIRATKGPEYTPLDETVTLGPGKLSLRLTISRWAKWEDWLSGDSRCHFLPPHAALLEAAGEGLDVVNVLIKQHPAFSHDGHLYPMAEMLTAFSGQEAALECEDVSVVVNTLNAHPSLGRVGLLNSHRVIFPLSFGGEEPDDWSLCDWCDQCHRKKGLTVWTDPFQSMSGVLGGEALVAALLGKIDAIEVDPKPRPQPFLPWYYRLLNAGIKLPLVGGSAKDSNGMPLGAMRTYAKVTEPGHRGWVEGVRAGRTFVTNGPLLSFAVSESLPGEALTVNDPVKMVATAESNEPFERFEIVSNGAVLATWVQTRQDDGRYFIRVEMEGIPQESGWVAARAVGSQAFAHTSPVYLDVPGVPNPQRAASLPMLKKCMEETKQWIEDYGRFTELKRRTHLLELCAKAQEKLGEPEA